MADDNKLSSAATILLMNNYKMEARLALEVFKHFAGSRGKFSTNLKSRSLEHLTSVLLVS